MFTLMPQDPNIGYVILAMIFVSATLLGFASHAPGGIGVFDAAMLVGLWQFDKEDLLAGLLLFRLLYGRYLPKPLTSRWRHRPSGVASFKSRQIGRKK
jgi:hypothetical protein